MGGVVDSILGTEATPASAIGRPSFDISGGLTTGGFDAATGEVTTGLDPRLAGLQEQLLGGAGAFLGEAGAGSQLRGLQEGFLGQLGEFDPFQAAETQFNRLDTILEPGRTRARSGTAASLLSSGRLGSTGGARTQAALEGEIERQRQTLLGEQFEGAQRVQQGLFGLGAGLQGLEESRFGMGQQALAGALGLDTQALQALGIAADVSAPVGVDPGKESGFSSLLGGALGAAGSFAGSAAGSAAIAGLI